jgi:hypothetical protein
MTRSEFAQQRKEFSKKSVEELLELLESDELRTRFLAEMSLRDATGT